MYNVLMIAILIEKGNFFMLFVVEKFKPYIFQMPATLYSLQLVFRINELTDPWKITHTRKHTLVT